MLKQCSSLWLRTNNQGFTFLACLGTVAWSISLDAKSIQTGVYLLLCQCTVIACWFNEAENGFEGCKVEKATTCRNIQSELVRSSSDHTSCDAGRANMGINLLYSTILSLTLFYHGVVIINCKDEILYPFASTPEEGPLIFATSKEKFTLESTKH
jgi:hypothetical protein